MKSFLLAALAALLLPLAASAADSGQLVDVVATGHGSTVREATKAALRAAVEQVVGTMVDATTLVENDELIEDEILRYSVGMVESAKQIGEPKKSADGFYTVKVKATVKKGKVEEKLRTASAVNVTLDGADLFARMTAAQDNLADAEAMIKDVLAKHLACVVAEAVPGENGTSPLDLDPKTGEVFANVRVRIDMVKYQQFAKEVVDKLGPMAETQTRMASKDYKGDGQFRYQGSFKNQLFVIGNYRTGNADIISLDKNRMDAVLNCLAPEKDPAFEVVLHGKNGDEMSCKPMIIGKDYNNNYWSVAAFNRDRRLAILFPMFGKGWWFNSSEIEGTGSYIGYTERSFRVSLGNFTADELKTAGKLEIKLGHMKNGQFVE